MKLGEMQTYEYSHSQGKMMPDPDNAGDYVLFSDAQAKSLADERRIAELEDWIRNNGKHGYKCTTGPYAVKDECFCGLSELRKTL